MFYMRKETQIVYENNDNWEVKKGKTISSIFVALTIDCIGALHVLPT